MAESSFFEGFRPVKVGDRGYDYKTGKEITITSKEVKARRYINPATGEIIPIRQYQNRQRGVTYTKFVREREKKGIKKKEYKTKGHVKISATPRKKQPVLRQALRYAKVSIEYARARRDYLQDAFARKMSEKYGTQLYFSELSDEDKTLFWEFYHDLIKRHRPPTYSEFLDEEYQEYFDLDYDDMLDIHYGDTP